MSAAIALPEVHSWADLSIKLAHSKEMCVGEQAGKGSIAVRNGRGWDGISMIIKSLKKKLQR